MENYHLEEALDNHGGLWEEGKTRGYGVVVIDFEDLTFAIPLRSNIRHKAAYLTAKENRKNSSNKGLDFTKALLISDERYVTDEIFNIPSEEHDKLRTKSEYIMRKFEAYVSSYRKAIAKNDLNILKSHEYRFTTLINYHSELLLDS